MRAFVMLAPVLVLCLVCSFTVRALAAESPAGSTCPELATQWTLARFDGVEVHEYPWGWIRWTMNDQLDPNTTMTTGIVYLKPNQTNPMHVHPNSDEILTVVEGMLEHRLGEGWVKMGPGDTIRIPKGAKHNARTGKQPCKVFVVYNTGQRQFVPVEEDKR